MSGILDQEFSSPPSSLQPPSSPGYDDLENPDEEPQSQTETKIKAKAKTKDKSKGLQYPADIPRLTKFGLCTYGINTGPLPDGIDWSKLSVPILKEQLAMRNIDDKGKKADLVERLNNWKNFKAETVPVRDAPENRPFGPISKTSSVRGEKRYWINLDEKSYISAAKKAMQESMYITKLRDNYGSDNNVLTHVLRAPAELLPQRTLFVDELSRLMDHAPKVRLTAAEVNGDPAMSNGAPKPKDGKSCPVCFKDLGTEETVCCGKCGCHTHSACFAVFAEEHSGWGVKCAVCQADWTAFAVQ
ncbi:hypothetical protein EsH8_VIII_000722 [Colletotrichum jinshuiense]